MADQHLSHRSINHTLSATSQAVTVAATLPNAPAVFVVIAM
ncbi:hypothetical protein [Allocoleopsis sp.]